MNKKFKESLFIFRRDLRVEDNSALIEALKNSEKVIPIFIFDPKQISSSNKFKSNNAIQFMLESLDSLDKDLKNKNGQLYLFYGSPEKIVNKIIKEKKIEAVFVNRDYTPFSIKRDKSIEQICKQNKIEFVSCDDILLNSSESVLTGTNEPYSVFTAYYKNASKNSVPKPQQNRYKNYYKSSIKSSESKSIFKKILKKENENLWVHGGRANFQKIIRNIKKFKNYSKTRNFPYL